MSEIKAPPQYIYWTATIIHYFMSWALIKDIYYSQSFQQHRSHRARCGPLCAGQMSAGPCPPPCHSDVCLKCFMSDDFMLIEWLQT